jgi:transposase
VAAEGASTVLGMLDERRTNLSRQRTRTVNQLHALLRELLPGGAPTDLTAGQAAGILARIRPASPVEQARKALARDLVADIRALDTRLNDNQKRMQDAVAESGSSLPNIVGVGPVVTARVLGRTGRASRFPSAAAFAVHVGAAPIEIASADKARHRLSRQRGPPAEQRPAHDRVDTSTHVRNPWPRLLRPQDRRGKTHKEAMRCLKHRLADHVWRVMIADERRQAHAAGPGGHTGATLTSSATSPTPTAGSSDKSLPGPAGHHSTATPNPAA